MDMRLGQSQRKEHVNENVKELAMDPEEWRRLQRQ